MTHDGNKIRSSASELIDRLGKGAIQYAQDRVQQVEEQGNARELDQAYRLLTEVENLLNKET
jgi:hypothetical protein